MQGGVHEGKTNNEDFSFEQLFRLKKGGLGYLCPIGVEKMSVQGNFGSESFNYVKIEVEGCDLGEAEGDCMSDDELIFQSVNFVNLRAYPSLLGNNPDEIVAYSLDTTYFKMLDPSY